MKKIRVMIVEDSPVTRELLQHIVSQDARLEVVAAVGSAEEALRILPQASPDVISMDIRLPGMNGLDATKRIMTERPTPIVVIAGSVAADDLNIGINALRAGALSVMEKPVGVTHQDYEVVAGRVCTQLAIMSQVKVVRRRLIKDIPIRRESGTFELPETRAALPRRGKNVAGAAAVRISEIESKFKMMGLVASTGGPGAVLQVLCGLGPNFPLPILLVQHITADFLEGFVAWLGVNCPFKVFVAKGGEIPAPGSIYAAPSGRHLAIETGRLRLEASAPVSFQCPSGTVLFQSMARSLGPKGIGVLLTGMGDDGASGLLELRQAGGYTIAEDESTAVVYGMPAEASRMGAVCDSLPLPSIAPRIIETVFSQPENI